MTHWQIQRGEGERRGRGERESGERERVERERREGEERGEGERRGREERERGEKERGEGERRGRGKMKQQYTCRDRIQFTQISLVIADC